MRRILSGLGLAVLLFGLLINMSIAEQPPSHETADGHRRPIEAKASFMQAAYVLISRQDYAPRAQQSEIWQRDSLFSLAVVEVKGIAEETMVMTCGIETSEKSLENNTITYNARDCTGSSAVQQQQVLAGQSLKSEIRLSQDNLPSPDGRRRSQISIQVVYI